MKPGRKSLPHALGRRMRRADDKFKREDEERDEEEGGTGRNRLPSPKAVLI